MSDHARALCSGDHKANYRVRDTLSDNLADQEVTGLEEGNLHCGRIKRKRRESFCCGGLFQAALNPF